MARNAHEHEIDLLFYLTPMHASFFVQLEEAGLSPRYEWLLRELVQILEEEADRVGKEPHVIWDFSYPNDITQEPLPEYGDVSPMKWYWEFSHYREELGGKFLTEF